MMEVGQMVTAFYKTGKYIGEITGARQDTYTVRILSVLIHPIQGDLHNPRQADVPLFLERKALAFREQANIPIKMVKPFDGDVLDYKDSLKTAFYKLSSELASKPEDAYCVRSLEALQVLQKEYERMYTMTFDREA